MDVKVSPKTGCRKATQICTGRADNLAALWAAGLFRTSCPCPAGIHREFSGESMRQHAGVRA